MINGLFNTILAIIISLSISAGVSNIAEVDPADATQDFIDGITSGNEEVIAGYSDNEYVNFLENIKGTDEDIDIGKDILFKNLDYKIIKTSTRGDFAVVKVKITTSDFSKVMSSYKEESYKYVTYNLYNEKVTDKKKLNRQCIKIYFRQIEKIAENGETIKKEVFIPMEKDGYMGWRILLNDEMMKAMLGDLELPVSK